jgi:hypothetical protein
MTLLRSILFTLILSTQTFSQQVSVQMPGSQGYVGVPMKFIIVYENVQTPVNPTFPEIDGFNIVRLPNEQTSQRTTILNGKMTQTTTRAVTFVLTPNKSGVFTIPALTFTADGKPFQSTPRVISIEQPPTGGALKVEISGTDNDVYLGQPIDLTLNIFIEAFTDQRLGITLSGRDMVSLLRGEFGIFRDAIDEGNISLREVRGNTDAGNSTTFYVLSVQATTWPETAGPFHMDPVSVLMNYPLSLIKERGIGIFGGQSLKVEQSNLISASGEMPVIEVLTPPHNDKPAWFSGAVGTYDFRIIAEPTRVKVGEPITITMRVTARTSGPINLDFLSPPLLDRVPALTNHFRVPDAPLGGIVEGRTKTFTQSIRPRNDGTIEIPPLPMTSFDPITLSYKTVWTKAIPISVEAVATVSAGDLLGTNEASASSTQTKLTEVVGGILANYTGDNVLRSQNISMTPFIIAAVVAPPCTFLCVLGGLFYSKRQRSSKLSPKGRAKVASSSIKRARSLQGTQQVETISNALRELQKTQEDDNFTHEIELLIRRCDALKFGGLVDATLPNDAESLVEAIR